MKRFFAVLLSPVLDGIVRLLNFIVLELPFILSSACSARLSINLSVTSRKNLGNALTENWTRASRVGSAKSVLCRPPIIQNLRDQISPSLVPFKLSLNGSTLMSKKMTLNPNMEFYPSQVGYVYLLGAFRVQTRTINNLFPISRSLFFVELKMANIIARKQFINICLQGRSGFPSTTLNESIKLLKALLNGAA